MPFSSRGGFLSQPAAAAGGSRREGAASTNPSQTYIASGGSSTSATEVKFGTKSYYASTNGTEIYTTQNPGFMSYGTGDFCIEWWINIPTLVGHGASSDFCSNNVYQGFGWRLGRRFNNSGLSSGGLAKYINCFARGFADLEYWDISTGTSGPSTWQTNTWYFCVLQRKNANMVFWLDGIKKTRAANNATYSADTFNFTNSTTSNSRMYLGTADGGNGAGPIYIDEMCWSNSWRYDDTGDFTDIPTAPFIVDTYTEQLMHFDGSFANATS